MEVANSETTELGSLKQTLHKENTLNWETIKVASTVFGLLQWENGPASPVDHSPTAKLKRGNKALKACNLKNGNYTNKEALLPKAEGT
jgi:hypothetical protein